MGWLGMQFLHVGAVTSLACTCGTAPGQQHPTHRQPPPFFGTPSWHTAVRPCRGAKVWLCPTRTSYTPPSQWREGRGGEGASAPCVLRANRRSSGETYPVGRPYAAVVDATEVTLPTARSCTTRCSPRLPFHSPRSHNASATHLPPPHRGPLRRSREKPDDQPQCVRTDLWGGGGCGTVNR
jgi:hypothetical protein